MATLRIHGKKWQSIIRIVGRPILAKSFQSKTDAKRWANETEIKIRREDAGIAKIKFPSFRDISLRYLNEVSIHKKCHRDERYTINSFGEEPWSEYPINKITPLIIGKYRDKQREVVKDNTINRKLDVISTIYTTCKKEWGYPVVNPVLSIRRPKMSEPLTRRLSDREINLLLKGNRTSEILKHATLPFNIKQDRLTKQFKRLCNHYGIQGVRFHTLRHQSLTNFMKVKKLDVPSTMLIAGHSDPRMLLRIYNNLKVEDVAKKLN